jgi:DNA repair protein RadA/Sms
LDQPAAKSGLPDLDRVLGQGLQPASAVLLGGEPGIGKSTLLLQLAGQVAKSGHKAVYFSAEESLGQLASRAKRLGLDHPGLMAVCSTQAGQAADILASAEAPALLVVDSVQTMVSSAADGVPGSPGQVRAVASELVEAVKKSGSCLMLVGHVTKEGLIAGPKMLEHMVDTVLYLEGDRGHFFRILRVFKNRFGPTDELLVLEMLGEGLVPVPDSSTYFLGDRDLTASGSAVVLAMEGKRPFAVEVQALASKSFLAIPRRTALGLDLNRLNLLLAVLEKRLGVGLGQWDIYAKTGGGLKLSDPGLDLGLVAAVLSSYYDRPLPGGAVFWGEVDLSGRVRPVAGQDTRLKQAKRLGYGPIFHPEGKGSLNLKDFQKALFGAKS